VTTLPAGASVWLDGTYLGQTPVYVDDLLPGQHGVTISRTGWLPETATFDVVVSRVTPVSIIMRRALQGDQPAQLKGQGALSIRGDAPGARVYIDGVAIGQLPVESRSVQAGYHIVTLEPAGKGQAKTTRIVDVFPDTTTVVEIVGPLPVAVQPNPADDILEPLDSVVPADSVVIAGDDVTIHFRGAEVQCAIGSRTYTFNGKAGTLAIPPALVGGKVYLPLSLLRRLAGK